MGKPVLGRLVVFLYSFFATLSSFACKGDSPFCTLYPDTKKTRPPLLLGRSAHATSLVNHPASGCPPYSAGLCRRPLRRRLLARREERFPLARLWGRGSGVIFAGTRPRAPTVPALSWPRAPGYSPRQRLLQHGSTFGAHALQARSTRRIVRCGIDTGGTPWNGYATRRDPACQTASTSSCSPRSSPPRSPPTRRSSTSRPSSTCPRAPSTSCPTSTASTTPSSTSSTTARASSASACRPRSASSSPTTSRRTSARSFTTRTGSSAASRPLAS